MPQQLYGPSRHSSSLADVIDVILDKGIVIDIYVSVSLVGIELLTIQARIVIASVDTYLRYARAVMEMGEEYGRQIPLAGERQGQSLTDFVGDTVGAVTESASESKTKGVVRGAKEALTGDRKR